jgi:hypothetical protein
MNAASVRVKANLGHRQLLPNYDETTTGTVAYEARPSTHDGFTFAKQFWRRLAE